MDLTPIPTGNDVQVNTFTIGGQRYPAVAALAGGGFVVTWSSYDQDGSEMGIYGQRYAADGTAVGSEFRINTHTPNHQVYSSVSALAGGSFVATWTSYDQDGSGYGIYGQRYAPDGTALGSEFRVNTFTNDLQVYPSVSALGGGGFVVTWTSYGQDSSGTPGVYGQRYAADGTPLGSEFRTNTYTTDGQMWPSQAALAGGSFVVTWTSYDQDGSGYGIYGQRYAPNGTALGSEFRVNSFTANEQAFPSVAALGGGGFVVMWSSYDQDGSGYGIYGQRYAPDGIALGSEFRINTFTTYSQVYPSVAALAAGGFVVTWSSGDQDGSGWGIYGQRYAPDGTALGSEFRINQITDGYQSANTFYGSETVATLADGRLVQVWSGEGTEEVFFRLINVPNIVLDDTATTNEDTAINVSALANDTFEGTPAITGTTNGAHGTVAINNNGTPGNTADDFVVFTPAADFNGTDMFTYTVTSGGLTETATVSVTVNGVADIADDTATTNEDTAVNVLVQGNDTFDNPAHQITAVTNGAHGTVTIDDNGTPGNPAGDFVVYAPFAGYAGPDTFTYTVTSKGTTETATVTITVAAILSGTPTTGNDSLVGTDGPDTIVALAGDDIIDGLGAGDLLFGNQGDDRLLGGTGNDTLVGGQGDDSVFGGGDNDLLFGNEGSDTIRGGDGDNTIVGGQDASDAADLITSGSGNDFVLGNGGADTISAGDGNNTLVGGFGRDQIAAGSGDDLIWGNQDNDIINAGGGANIVWGGFGEDTIVAGSGNDTIWGNEGNDTLAGGAGADRYVFGAGSGSDQVNGFVFAEGDRLDVQSQTFTLGASADGDVLLTLSGGGTIELNGVAPAGFSPTFVL